MKILLNRKPLYNQAYGGGNLFLQAFCDLGKQRGHDIIHRFEDGQPDVIFMHDPRPSELRIGINEIAAYVNAHPWTQVVHRVNECDARKGTKDMDQLLQAASSLANATIFVSKWMKNYHTSATGYTGGKHHVIHNGVNHDHFHPFSGIRKSNGLIHIVAHHWSNNRMKGFDVYEAIDRFVGENKSEFTFEYIGRELGTFKNTRVTPPLYGEELGARLSVHDVYVSGSLYDPGPNHCLEAIACGLPTYVCSDGGGSVEFAGSDHVFNSIDELVRLLQMKQFHKNSYVPQTWEQCMDQYFNVIEGL